MSYPGYQQYPQGGGYPQQRPYPARRESSPALAVVSGIVGLGLAGVLTWQTLDLMSLIDGAGLPEEWTAMNIAHLVLAGLFLMGAVLVFARFVAGAVLLCVTSVGALGVLLLVPLVIEEIAFSMLGGLPGFVPNGEYSDYFRAMFEFGNEQAVLRFVALVLAFILLITSVLPPSLNWLKGRRDDSYGPQHGGW